jgi:hypothetical protein
LIGGYLVC